MSALNSAQELSGLFASIYFHCHPTLEVELSHQAVRAMQFISMRGPSTIHHLSSYLDVKHNTASEIVRRLESKNLVRKQRALEDERVVEVHLTQMGTATVLQHTGLDVNRLTQALEAVSEEERRDIQDCFGNLLHAIRKVENDGISK